MSSPAKFLSFVYFTRKSRSVYGKVHYPVVTHSPEGGPDPWLALAPESASPLLPCCARRSCGLAGRGEHGPNSRRATRCCRYFASMLTSWNCSWGGVPVRLIKRPVPPSMLKKRRMQPCKDLYWRAAEGPRPSMCRVRHPQCRHLYTCMPHDRTQLSCVDAISG